MKHPLTASTSIHFLAFAKIQKKEGAKCAKMHPSLCISFSCGGPKGPNWCTVHDATPTITQRCIRILDPREFIAWVHPKSGKGCQQQSVEVKMGEMTRDSTWQQTTLSPSLEISPRSAQQSLTQGGGDGPQVTVSPLGGGGGALS